MIAPHGGKLISRMVTGADADALRTRAGDMPVIELNNRESSDVLLIANGAMSPLEGFMTSAQYRGTLDSMHLPTGEVWSLPVTLSLKTAELQGMSAPFTAALKSDKGVTLGIIDVEDVYTVDHADEAQKALGTTDDAHPGVQYLGTISNVYAGGKITICDLPSQAPFEAHHKSPAETRAMFESKGWGSVCAFQTRNPIHRAHEYLLKCALEIVDGLLVHPIMGETKSDDVPAAVRWECYETLLNGYFNPERTALTTFPAAMRYAGPKEAIFHAILRQNYGCTHFIVGRDHAGVGNYYGTYDAQEIFDTFKSGEIAITPLKFEHAFYSHKAKGMASDKTAPPKDGDERVFLSGTKVREMLTEGKDLPEEFTRREVSDILQKAYRS